VTERAAPFYCPYCGDEDLRPHEAGHGAWLCGACRRAFTLKYLGVVFRERDAAGDSGNKQAPSAGSAEAATNGTATDSTTAGTATTSGKEAT
jgi:predicted RNA-binding Zn-ribbon protein involved in translation (DUF1610 family)